MLKALQILKNEGIAPENLNIRIGIHTGHIIGGVNLKKININ